MPGPVDLERRADRLLSIPGVHRFCRRSLDAERAKGTRKSEPIPWVLKARMNKSE